MNPNHALAHQGLGAALGEGKGDWDGAMAEFREAIRLNPNNDMAHVSFGVALGRKDNLGGEEIAEYREALRLNPNNDLAHHNLGVALEWKGDHRGALAEYRAACLLDPKDANYRQNYERLLRQVNR